MAGLISKSRRSTVLTNPIKSIKVWTSYSETSKGFTRQFSSQVLNRGKDSIYHTEQSGAVHDPDAYFIFMKNGFYLNIL